MSFSVKKGNLLEAETDAIVIPASPQASQGCGVSRHVYEAAGKNELLRERKKIGYMKPGMSAGTPAFRLHADYIIHTVTPLWRGGMFGETECLVKCYISALEVAEKFKAGSIAFPLLGSGHNHIPLTEAYDIACKTIEKWLKDHGSDMNVSLVIFESDYESLQYSLDIKHDKSIPESSEKDEFEQFLKKNPGTSREDFNRKKMRDIMGKYIANYSEFAKIISRSSTTLSRIHGGKTRNPSKNVIVSLSVAMLREGISPQERLEFIKCAGFPDYPDTDMDIETERIISSGITDFQSVLEELYSINSSWNLIE